MTWQQLADRILAMPEEIRTSPVKVSDGKTGEISYIFDLLEIEDVDESDKKCDAFIKTY